MDAAKTERRESPDAGLGESGKPVLRDWLNFVFFVAVAGLLFVLNLVIRPPALLTSERRAPAQLPEFSLRSVASGSFMSKFEAYAADRFVFRDSFRTLRAAAVFGLLLQSDKSGLYFGDAGVGEFKTTDAGAMRQSAEKIKRAMAAFSGCRVYYSFIPDKSLYAGKYLPGFDPETAEKILGEVLGEAAYIPLTDCLGADSFYRTDLHWDQPAALGAAARLAGAMGAAFDAEAYTEKFAGEFKGVYAGQMALPMAPDRMRYMELPSLRARRLDDATMQFVDCPVYDTGRFQGLDPYDLFLQGPQALVELENPDAPGGELYLFRDSYGSSLAPLLAGAWRKITLIDLRYIDMRVLDQFVTVVPGADVLFLYSTQILNNPSILKV